MTVIRTVFIKGEVWRRLIEEHPGYRIAEFADGTLVTVREVVWPTETSYGDFDENGWLRRNPLEVLA